VALSEAAFKMPAEGVPLRFVTYLSPSIPFEYFQFVAQAVTDLLNEDITSSKEKYIPSVYHPKKNLHSGPTCIGRDPFTKNKAEIAFM
jgi:hypothetical protein